MKEEILDNDLDYYTPEEENIYDKGYLEGYIEGRNKGDSIGLAYLFFTCTLIGLVIVIVKLVEYAS